VNDPHFVHIPRISRGLCLTPFVRLFESIAKAFVEAWKEMAVAGEGQTNRGVPESFLDLLGVCSPERLAGPHMNGVSRENGRRARVPLVGRRA
jgi:hypothetical protein